MKKITLFAAVAALTAGTALGAAPRVQSAAKPQRLARHMFTPAQLPMRAQHAMAKASAISGLRVKAAADAQTGPDADDVVTITNTARYTASEQAFYMGISPQYYGYGEITVGLTGIRNRAGFYNLTSDADSQTWLWREPIGVNETQTGYIYDDHTSTDRNLLVTLKPDLFFESPTLTAKFDNDEVSYTDDVVLEYYCGGSLYDWNWAVNKDKDYADLTVNDVFGVGVAALPYVQDWFPYSAWMLPRTNIENVSDQFTAEGSYKGWNDLFSQFTDAKYENPAITGFTTLIPIMPSPYQLGHMWVDFMADVKAEMELTAIIAPITDEGIDYEHPIGRGSVILQPGEYPLATQNDKGTYDMEMPVIEFYALDSEGYETDIYPCIYNTPVAVTISGFNSSNADFFIPMTYGNTVCALEEEEVADYMFPGHSYVNLSVDCTPKTEGATTEKITAEMPTNIFPFYANADRDSLLYATDYGMFFNIEFPTLTNITEGAADNGTANFSTRFEAAGGTQSVDLFSYYDVPGMLEEGLMTASYSEGGEEWLSFTCRLEQEDENSIPVQVFDVTAKALPEGVKGRQGYILFSGMACDFAIVATQGEVSGINDIKVVPVAKGTQFFDLQGRRLNGAPAAGLYIERIGDKAVKRIAR